ncbi:hypothetical protein ACQPZJ_18085 [Actinoplanes sp. CA-054009]
MAYDVLGESLKLISDGLPEGPVRLSRRRRFAPVAVDVSDEVASARFVRRGVGCFWDDTHRLVRKGSEWTLLGGSSGSTGEWWSSDEFERARNRLPTGGLEVQGHGGNSRDSGWRTRWVRTAELLAGPEVSRIVVDDRREMTVPGHGHLVVVWGTRRPPRITACDADGRGLTNLVLPRGR